MIINYVRHDGKSYEGSVEYHRNLPLVFCCERMREIWEQGIQFGSKDYYGKGNTVNIGVCHPYPEGACWDDFPIDFCPFCGERIECVQTEHIRRVWTTKRKRITENVTSYEDTVISEGDKKD